MIKIILFLLAFQWTIPLRGQNMDIRILRDINLNRPVSLDGAARFTSKTATPVSLALPVTLLAVGKLSGNKDTWNNGLKSSLAIVASMSVSTVLKYTIHRDRPYVTYPDIQPLSGDFTSSFPSGHTTSAFCTATTLTLMYPKWYVYVPAYSWACMVSYSRMHMGMHYPSDVLAGAIIGTGISFLSFKFQHWIGKN